MANCKQNENYGSKKPKLENGVNEKAATFYKIYEDPILGKITDLVSDDEDDNSRMENNFETSSSFNGKLKTTKTKNDSLKSQNFVKVTNFVNISSNEMSNGIVSDEDSLFFRRAKKKFPRLIMSSDDSDGDSEDDRTETKEIAKKISKEEINSDTKTDAVFDDEIKKTTDKTFIENNVINFPPAKLVRQISVRSKKSIAIGTTSNLCVISKQKPENNASAESNRAVSEMSSIIELAEQSWNNLNSTLAVHRKNLDRLKTIWNSLQPAIVSVKKGETNSNAEQNDNDMRSDTQCRICSMKVKRTELENHLWKKHRHAPYKFRCSECTQTSSTLAYCQSHITKRHNDLLIRPRVIRVPNVLPVKI